MNKPSTNYNKRMNKTVKVVGNIINKNGLQQWKQKILLQNKQNTKMNVTLKLKARI